MQRILIKTDAAPSAIGPYSQAIQVGDMLYTSGQIPLDPLSMEIVEGGVKEQTMQVMQNLLKVVEAGGGDAGTVIKTTCFLSDMENFAAFNEVYAGFFPVDPPARSCVEVARLPKDVLVEVEAIALVK